MSPHFYIYMYIYIMGVLQREACSHHCKTLNKKKKKKQGGGGGEKNL